MANAQDKSTGSERVGETDEANQAGEASEQHLYHHGDLRAALIRAGLAILAEEGVQALTLRAAARRAGVSHNAPYRHFADKEALLAAIAEEGFIDLAARVEEARAHAAGSSRPQLEESGWAYVQFALAHPDHLRVMFGVPFTNPGAHPGLLSAGARAFNNLVAIIEDGQRAGEFIEGNSRQLAFSAWSLVHGLALLLANQQAPGDIGASYGQEELVRLCIRQQHQGLMRRP